jgi:putative ABC transport system permease protein
VIVDAVREAARTCRGNPLRSSLGALAIAFAVATVGVVVSALDGLSAFTRETTAKAFGSETFVIARIGSPGQMSRKELQNKLERNLPIRRADFRFLAGNAGDRVRYAPSAQRAADVVAGSRKLERVSVTGTTSSLVQIRDLEIGSGRFFQQFDDDHGSQVAFIGAEVASVLFPTADPLGREIRIAGRGFEIIGVQARIGSSGGATLDRYVWIPLTAFERIFGVPDSLQVFARPAKGLDIQSAEDQAGNSLRARRRLQPGVPDNFDVLLPDAARSLVTTIGSRVGVAAFPISAMALLAAIVVVTNTTLSSVRQRIREIGVRRAVGATRGQIVLEVLSESTLVSLAGGTVGIVVVILLVRTVSGLAGLSVAVHPVTMVIALLAAAFSGVAAGLYPARRASSGSVVDAMRTE